jgi:hypothetical protein
MGEPEGHKPGLHPYRVQTIINNLTEHRQIAWLDGPLWLPVGTVIELGNPNRDAVVIGCRLQIPTGTSSDMATILVDVNEGAPWQDFIPRDPTSRLLESDPGA